MGPFSLYIGPSRVHPGNGINGARRGRSLPVSPAVMGPTLSTAARGGIRFSQPLRHYIDDWMASGDADEERPGTQGAGRGAAGGPSPSRTDGEQLAGYSDSLWRLFRPPRENTGPERDEWPRWKHPE